MRLAMISDVHANLEALRVVLDDIAAQGVDRILCLGDIVGYNADPAACLALLRSADALCVAGNHDRAVAGSTGIESFPAHARRAVEWTRRQLDLEALTYLAGLPLQAELPPLLVAVHGTLTANGGSDRTYLDSDERRLECLHHLAAHPSKARICAFGHTHELGVIEWRDGRLTRLTGERFELAADGYYLVNPGTVGEPRSRERRATYICLDSDVSALEVRRLDYDVATTLTKRRAAGLPPTDPFPAPVTALRSGLRRLGLAGVARAVRRSLGGTRIDG